MSAGWEASTLGDAATVIAGQSPDGSAYNDYGKGMPFYQGKKEFDEKFIGEPTTWTTQVKRVAEAGDVLMSVRAPVGPVNFATQECCIGRGLAAIRSGPRLNRDFLFYYLLHKRDEIAGTEGAVFACINKDQIEAITLPLPPLAEQQRIIGILDEAFAAIGTAKANTEKNLQNARAVFSGHLQHVCSKQENGWTRTTLGGVCDLFQGLAINAKSKHLLVPFSNLPLLRIKDLRDNSSEQFVAETGYPQGARVRAGDIVYTRTGQVGLVFRGRDGVLHNNCFKVVPRQCLTADYLFWWLQSPPFRERIMSLAAKTAQPDITHTLFKEQPINVPPHDFQRRATARIEELDALASSLESKCRLKLAALDALKASLLHHAFTGQLTGRPSVAVAAISAR